MLKYSEIKIWSESRSSHGYSYEEREVYCSKCNQYIGTQHRRRIDEEEFRYELPVMKLYNYCPYCGEKF